MAVLGGYRPFVCLIGGARSRAIELLAPIRKAILDNSLLEADFPKAIYPLQRLENNARLATAEGDRGTITLFGKNPEHHNLFAEHVAESEYYVITEGQGRTVHEWKAKPSKTDNHWLDCLVGCAVAASMQGCVTAEMSVRPKREVKRTKFSQLVGERS